MMNFIKSQDIIVLIKVLREGKNKWKFESLQNDLQISMSAIHRSLERCVRARFISPRPFDDIYILNISEFLIHGIAYTFAIEPGKITRGIATAHSAPPLKNKIISDKDIYVWPYPKGNLRGQSIEPLMKQVPEIIQHDPPLYEILVLIDAIRIGRTREKEIAANLLKARLLHYAGKY
ncbi:MAG: hypothetical protein ACYCOO_01325 [Chitinophagaceae bacterium]